MGGDRPKLRSDLLVQPVEGAGSKLYQLRVPGSSSVCTLYDVEYSVARLLDGTRSLEALAPLGAGVGVPMTVDQLRSFVRDLAAYRLLVDTGAEAPAAATSSTQAFVHTVVAGTSWDAPQRPKLRPNLDIREVKRGEGTFFELKSPTGATCQLYDIELGVAKLMDGNRKLETILADSMRQGLPITMELLHKFMRQLAAYGLIENAAPLATRFSAPGRPAGEDEQSSTTQITHSKEVAGYAEFVNRQSGVQDRAPLGLPYRPESSNPSQRTASAGAVPVAVSAVSATLPVAPVRTTSPSAPAQTVSSAPAAHRSAASVVPNLDSAPGETWTELPRPPARELPAEEEQATQLNRPLKPLLLDVEQTLPVSEREGASTPSSGNFDSSSAPRFTLPGVADRAPSASPAVRTSPAMLIAGSMVALLLIIGTLVGVKRLLRAPVIGSIAMLATPVRSPTAGKISRVLVRTGDKVRAGEMLFQVKDEALELNLDAWKKAVTLAETAREKILALNNPGHERLEALLSASELALRSAEDQASLSQPAKALKRARLARDKAKARTEKLRALAAQRAAAALRKPAVVEASAVLEKAIAARDELTKRIESFQVNAPVEGLVTGSPAAQFGRKISTDDVLIELSSPVPNGFQFALPPGAAPYKSGDLVAFTPLEAKGQPLRARVRTVAPEPSTGGVQVYAEALDPLGVLRVGDPVTLAERK